MHLPKKIVSYFRALLSVEKNFTLTNLASEIGFSHDQLTRFLNKAQSTTAYLRLLLSKKLRNSGYLIVDETDINKSYASVIEGLSWIFSHRFNRFVFGYHIVVIVWTNDVITIPVGFRMYKPNKDKSLVKKKTELAIELLDYALNKLKFKPKAVLFDAFYASAKILKYLDSNRITFISQIPKNRLLDNTQLKHTNNGRPYWYKIGCLRNKLKVLVVKHRRKYFITNDLRADPKEIRKTYSIRWRIEEVFRFMKQELGFERCECRSLVAQKNHFGCCLLAFALLQDTILNTGLNVYQIKREATQNHEYINLVLKDNDFLMTA